MPADRLTRPAPAITEQTILRLLTRAAPAAEPADGADRLELEAAAHIYQEAGRAALTHHLNTAWRQYYIRFTAWNNDEPTAATYLLPILNNAKRSGTVDIWWFIRKHPCWRLRILPASVIHADLTDISTALDTLVTDGHLDAWWPGLYEAETAAFGGGAAMEIAHRLFAADSLGVLELAAADGTGLGRRELSVLLCSALMRGADLEWYERGDVWDRVAAERHLPADIPADKITGMGASLRTLMIADTTSDGPQFGPDGPVASQRDWAEAFHDAGDKLGRLNHDGQLRRGLRDILSYHVIFHWNRLGLPARAQAILAHAARTAILGPREPARHTGAGATGDAKREGER